MINLRMKGGGALWSVAVCALAVAILAEAVIGDEQLVPLRREVYDDGRIFDISHRYQPDMPSWESDDGIGQFLWLPKSMKNGSLANNSEMKLPTHTGTHVDAPGHVFDHYFDAGFDVDSLDLHILNGHSPPSFSIHASILLFFSYYANILIFE